MIEKGSTYVKSCLSFVFAPEFLANANKLTQKLFLDAFEQQDI